MASPDYHLRGVKAEALLHDAMAWLRHWRADADHGLPPTRESLDALSGRLGRFLGEIEAEDRAADLPRETGPVIQPTRIAA